MVHVPGRLRRDGGRPAQVSAMRNYAQETGGSACTIRTVEKLTVIRIDHHVVVDFSGRDISTGLFAALCADRPVEVAPEVSRDSSTNGGNSAWRESVPGSDSPPGEESTAQSYGYVQYVFRGVPAAPGTASALAAPPSPTPVFTGKTAARFPCG